MSNNNGKSHPAKLDLLEGVINNSRPVEFGTEVIVEINPDNAVFKSFIDTFVYNALGELNALGGSIDLDADTLRNYCNTAIAARCELTANGRCNYWHRSEECKIPAFLAAALASIGIAEDTSLGLNFKPKYAGDESQLIKDKTERLRISQMLTLLERRGFKFADVLEYSRKGEINFLMMEVIENDVRARNNDAHPAYALLAAFFNVTGITKVLGNSALRVSYGDTQGFKHLVSAYACPRT